MGEKGCTRNMQQCGVKIKVLRQVYQKTRGVNSCSGSAPQTCRFYEELHAILGSNLTTTPKHSVDSSQEPRATLSNNREDIVEEEEEAENVRLASGGSIVPNSQELFITLETIPSQDRLAAERDAGEGTSGLKILRCCNHCEIVGTIKGEKKFKGAHWHCYRCRNGFNRRDEAVKHYKTHFRNPHTTFQIQITQDVNSRQYYQHSAEAHPKAYGGLHVSTGASVDVMAIGSVLDQTVLASGSPVFTTNKETENLLDSPAKDSRLNSRIMLGVEEMAGLSTSSSSLPTHQTLVLMDPDGDNGNIIFEEGANSVAGQPSEGLDQNLLEKQLIELHQQNQQLLEEKKEMEQKLQAEILQLKEHIASIVQANIRMAEELKRYRTSDDLEKKVSKMVEQMEWQHRELLQMQVAALRKEFAQKENRLMNGKSTPPADAALETRELAVTSSMHALLANAALASTNSTQFTLPNSPQDTATPRPLDISTGDVVSFIDPPESLPGSGGNSLEKLGIVELHLDTKPTIVNQEAGSPPAHAQLLPTGEMNEPMGLLPSPGGEKRLAQHMLARETKTKTKQQRTV